jgi:hypothetical protein
LEEDEFVEEVKQLRIDLEDEGELWKLYVVNKMLDEMARMERLLYPEWYWSKEFLRIKDV